MVMGRAARWIRGLLLGGKKAGEPPSVKKLLGSGKTYREKHHHQQQLHRDELRLPLSSEDEKERSKRAIAVAAATAAAAEAAVAAAQAAAVVVRLTASGGRTERNLEEEWAAAVKIQSTFRGYLARRALKALRGLVKLQALVRGNFVRKQAAETLRCMQALLRVQARARACRILSSARSRLPAKAFLPRAALCSPNPATNENYERAIRPIASSDRYFTLKMNSSRMEVDRASWWDDDHAAARKATNFSPADDDKNSKILEVDLGSFARSREMSNHHRYHHSSSCNTRSFPAVLASPSKDSSGESSFLYYGASSLYGSGGKKVDDDGDAQSLWSGCVDCRPNYMAKTESSRAKLRSQSAPRQRLQDAEKQGLVGKRSSAHVGGQFPPLLAQQRSGPPPPPPPPSLHAKFTNRAYPGSGRLDRLGMPLRI